MQYSLDEAKDLAVRACLAVGAAPAAANALAEATISAERHGRHSVGFAHLFDYLEGLLSGRISGTAEPELSYPAPAIVQADAKGGIAQLCLDQAFEELLARTKSYGVTVFSVTDSYTAGELGYYARKMAEQGLIALAATNGPALLAAGRSAEAVYGTNPFAFAAPTQGKAPLVFDQASSATAFVKVRGAAERGDSIPEGWAVDERGQHTTDSREAIKGALLAFGGSRGANIALMVEVLAAGVTGANWSLDAPAFDEGSESPGAGLFMVMLDPKVLDPSFSDRLASQVERLAAKGVHIPGGGSLQSEVDLPDEWVARLERYGNQKQESSQ
ncbi:Ldh family oxidoreductase [Saccharibacillus sacchari]|uniref:Ldh family oxidoreductase n=1 Tax=Saccharibacillus sacchari TaxID=456493 RepID=A0ACC6PG77_9BACL